MTQPTAPDGVCAACGHHASGRFCSNCGASLEPAACTACGSAVSPGARFCHNCGKEITSSGSEPAAAGKPTRSSTMPWMVAATALVVLLAFLAGSTYNRKRGSAVDAPQNALPQAGLDNGGPMGSAGTIRASDISQMSPEERADRLYNRVMLLNKEGKSDSVLFFAPMAIQAYEMLSPLNADQRYDIGRIAEVAGDLATARAQADTILSQSPTHLLGLVLAERVASLENRPADVAAFKSKLRSAFAAESARKLPEYERHLDDIKASMGIAPEGKKN